ncbi:LysR family transcriptional regulator [Aquincola tertiaricarbonis]|uniref:LysR family transcriptional regulator n=1 Tax=Aquincola tertiaricarbonis TaxID=391953 RepID=A0ABY4S4D2_AQUTE|nr:LysR family transcriptional regulator [Aquincola tertiaricarbonis]URI07080.1 LysR family transcriptional regulator [Aquincola tertiaricarbonis]
MSSPESPAPLSLDRIALMQTFVRIVEAGSLSAAAAQLGTTQPTISRRLQALERALGLPLLKRSTHTMKLTEDGERCYHRARALLYDWQALEADLRGAVDEPEGTLRVVVPHAFGQQRLVAPLADYLRRWPRVSVEWLLHDGTPDFVADGIDCAIHVGAVTDPSVVALRLSEVPRIVVAAPSVLAGRPPPAQAQALAELPWLALRTYYRDSITLTHEATGEQATLALRPRMATDSLYALRSAALEGLGVAVGSAWLMAEDLAAGRLLQLVPQWRAEPLPVWLVYPPGRWQPARLRRFIEVMRGAMAATAWGGLQEGAWS